jgi:tripartite-type tricarboxylate transporter receptor subunit TctC
MQWIAAGALAAARAVRADETSWPSRPIRLIVPGGVGGAIDLRARWLAERLAPRLGQPVVVDNRPGAGGNVGTLAGARAPADGSVLTLMHQGTMTVNPHLYAKTGFDPLTELVPIVRFGITPLLVIVHPDVPARSIAEFVAWGRRRTEPLAFGSPGVGTPPHLAAELFRHAAGFDAIHVPYRGGGQVAADLAAGQTQFVLEGLVVMAPHLAAGRMRALAVTGTRRLPELSDTPTLAESGWPDATFHGWMGLAAPSGTPARIVARTGEEVRRILDSQEGRDYLASSGTLPDPTPPDALAAAIRAEHADWGRRLPALRLRIE